LKRYKTAVVSHAWRRKATKTEGKERQ
jgi:hypothetical protein